MLKFGMIGLGHWGPNLFRNFYEHPEVSLEIICDRDPAKQGKLTRYDVPFTTDSTEITSADNDLDAIILATPLKAHFAIAKAALEAGKHLFIEKPIAPTAAEVKELMEIAQAKNLHLMVGHVFLYNAGIRYVKEQIDSGELGNILFIHGQRTNLGPVRNDANALWDLAAHDISIFNYWLNDRPYETTATGSCLLNPEIEDVVSASFHYKSGIKCNILASWLHPNKVRQITVVGDKKMLVWDDMAGGEPIKIFNKSIKHADTKEQVEGTISEFNFSIQDGQVLIPRVKMCEPLKTECWHFVDCLLENRTPLSDSLNGYEVVAALEAANKSMENNSQAIAIEY
ncbi:MAG: Gfo/Idh/MocA family oxidoreductase [Victivallaceae bacterium]|nr:Gfo/Idh/MocA family oxidoreductase [Victivallaceae bacterium]